MIDHINLLASQGDDFLFVVNYLGTKAYIKKLTEVNPDECLYDFEGTSNAQALSCQQEKLDKWQVFPPSFGEYKKSFQHVKANILAGNSYLTNLTCQAKVECNLSLLDIFLKAKGKYKLLLRDKKSLHGDFVCFSPETFVKIKGGRIYSYPMKGTLDAAIPNAKQVLMQDKKEAAEHATIVDLIRNDLSRVATEVRVDKYRYMDVLHTNKGDRQGLRDGACSPRLEERVGSR